MRSEYPREFWRKALHLLGGGSARCKQRSNALLVDSLAGHQWQLTLEWWHWLDRHGWSPDVVSYNVFLQALGRGQLWREAQLCFMNLQANKDGQGVQPNLRSFNTMLGVYEKASVWRQASALMASSTSIRPDKVTYHTLISTFGKGHQSLKAMQALESMRHSSLRPGLPGYNAAIRALAIEDNFEDFVGQRWGEALKLYRRMEEDSLRPDLGTYNGLVSVYGMAGEEEGPREIPRPSLKLEQLRQFGR